MCMYDMEVEVKLPGGRYYEEEGGRDRVRREEYYEGGVGKGYG